MTEEHSNYLSLNNIKSEENENLAEEAFSETFITVGVGDEHENETHDGKLSTIPEELESVASNFDDGERKQMLEIGLHQGEVWPTERAVVTEDVLLEARAIPADGEHVISVTERLVSTSEEYVEDTSSGHVTPVEQYKSLMLELTVAKHRNMLLQKKVLEHFKRRKIDAVSKTDVEGLDLEMKYLQQLKEFKQLKDELIKEEQLRENELEDLKKQAQSLNESAQVKLNELVTYINKTVDYLHFGTIDKTLQTEMIQRAIGKLVSKLGELSKLQLAHIKLRNRVTAQQEKKRELEACGEVLHLANYEQLRTENQNLVAQVEERDEELQRLRDKAMTAVHNLAHIRQKAWATDQAVKDKSCQLRTLEEQFAKMREKINIMKKEREHYLTETRKLRQEAGLLLKPTLLRDYEQSAEEVTRLSAELQNVRNAYYDDHRKLTSIRKMLELMRTPDNSNSVKSMQISIPCRPNMRRK